MPAKSWTVTEAKARFSELVEEARGKGPQTVTKNGREAVVVVAAEEWARRTRRVGSLVDFLASSPLRGSGVVIRRRKDKPREIEL